jgi:hypothetical protein
VSPDGEQDELMPRRHAYRFERDEMPADRPDLSWIIIPRLASGKGSINSRPTRKRAFSRAFFLKKKLA